MTTTIKFREHRHSAITKVEWCDFIVWTTKDMYEERILTISHFGTHATYV